MSSQIDWCTGNWYFCFKYDLGHKYYAPQVQPDRASNSWPPDHDSTFYVTEMPAPTTRPSVTSNSLYWFIFIQYHTIIRAAFVCLFVCSPTPPRSFDGSSPNLVGVCRWTLELPLRGSFLKRSTDQRVNGSNATFSEQTTPGWDHTAAKGTRRLLPSTVSFAQQKAHGV